MANLDLEKTAFVLNFSEVWPGVENLDLYTKMELPKGSKRRVKERLKPYVKDAQACDLIDKLLWLDPSKRINSDDALNHDFFWTDPMPCKYSNPNLNSLKMFFPSNHLIKLNLASISTVWKLRKSTLIVFSGKFREINALSTELRYKLFSFFLVRVKSRDFHTVA